MYTRRSTISNLRRPATRTRCTAGTAAGSALPMTFRSEDPRLFLPYRIT